MISFGESLNIIRNSWTPLHCTAILNFYKIILSLYWTVLEFRKFITHFFCVICCPYDAVLGVNSICSFSFAYRLMRRTLDRLSPVRQPNQEALTKNNALFDGLELFVPWVSCLVYRWSEWGYMCKDRLARETATWKRTTGHRLFGRCLLVFAVWNTRWFLWEDRLHKYASAGIGDLSHRSTHRSCFRRLPHL